MTTLINLIKSYLPISSITYDNTIHCYEYSIKEAGILLIKVRATYNTNGKKIIEVFILPQMLIDQFVVYNGIDDIWNKIRDTFFERRNKISLKKFLFLK